jgi:hypothetical protein
MKVITQKIKVYDFSDLAKDEVLKNNVLNTWREKNNFDTFYFDELYQVDSKVSEFSKEIIKEINNLEGEIKGFRLHKWLINNFSYIWSESKVLSKHINDNKVTFKSCYFAHKYGNCIKKRFSRIFKINTLDNCFLTGITYEYDFLKDFINFMQRPNNFDTIDTLLGNQSNIAYKLHNEIVEWLDSDDYILETIEANDYNFLYNGKIFN